MTRRPRFVGGPLDGRDVRADATMLVFEYVQPETVRVSSLVDDTVVDATMVVLHRYLRRKPGGDMIHEGEGN